MGAACAIPCLRYVRAMFDLCSSMVVGSARISLCKVAATRPRKIVFWNECCLCGKLLHVCSLCKCVWPKCVRVCHDQLGFIITFPSHTDAMYKMHVLACSRTYVRVNVCSKCSNHVRGMFAMFLMFACNSIAVWNVREHMFENVR